MTGKRRQKVVRFKGNKKDADRKMRDLIKEYESEGYVEPSKVKLGDYLSKWLVTAKDLVGPNTWEGYEICCRVHLIPQLGNQPLQKLQPMDIQNLYGRLLNGGRKDGKSGGLSPKSIKNLHGVLSKAYSDAVKWRKTTWNPTEAVKLPKKEDVTPDALTKDELAVLLNAAKGSVYYPIILVAATTGMRRGEILALKWSGVELDKRFISITQSVVETREEFRLKDVKTKRSKRRISIAPFLVVELRRVKARQSELRIRLGMGKDEDGLVFTNLDGTMRKPSLVTAEFGRLIRRLDITQTSFHGLRHTHISHLLSDGEPVLNVSRRVGHSSAAMTLDLYGHVMPDMQKDLAASYGAELEHLMEQAENE